ncbi:SUZ RNA-binding domain-containing isoform X3 [Oryctolagus cuniculus]|uniref:SUZ RNA-binding domain-containing isoform X3 n=1 Tax=Oryctolagus cuniculus TaxID=9986 RepID=UPI0038799107
MQCCWAGVGSGPRLTPGEWARDLCVRSRWWLRCCLGDAHRGEPSSPKLTATSLWGLQCILWPLSLWNLCPRLEWCGIAESTGNRQTVGKKTEDHTKGEASGVSVAKRCFEDSLSPAPPCAAGQSACRKSKSPPKVPIVIQDDSLPTGPPPQIRILKRPTSNGVVSSPNSTSRPALPVKSLAQREAEYAEARKRILGSASPEEEQEKPILDRPTRISQPEDSRQPNNVIRQPLGPDGSQGFKQRR